MADIVSNLISAILGAFFAFIIRELFVWKNQGRFEAIRKYDHLKTECYGILIPLITEMDVHEKYLRFTVEHYNTLRKIRARFSHRMPVHINGLVERLLFAPIDPPEDNWYTVSLDEENMLEFMGKLLKSAEDMETETVKIIQRLESYSQSFLKKICYNLKFWSDVM